MTAAPDDALREEAIRAGLEAVRARIAAACHAAGRDPQQLTLVVVTKFFPAFDVAALARLGVRHVGENRDQEASAKVREVAGLLDAAQRPRWHFIGQLQTNKAASVARYADVVHSVDRAKLARALAKGARAAGRELDVLLQINLDGPAEAGDGRGGAAPEGALELADLVGRLDGLRLRGVMGVAPLVEGAGSDGAAQAFAELGEVAAHVRSRHPQADVVSAGMSGDLEAAIEAGATHLRVGSAILGSRPAHG